MIDFGLVGYYGGKNVEQMLSTYMISKLLYNRESIPLPVGIVNYKKRHFQVFFHHAQNPLFCVQEMGRAQTTMEQRLEDERKTAMEVN